MAAAVEGLLPASPPMVPLDAVVSPQMAVASPPHNYINNEHVPAATPDATATPSRARSTPLAISPSPASARPYSARFSLTALRRSMSPPPASYDSPPAIGHQARVLYALITGSIPPPSPPSRAKRAGAAAKLKLLPGSPSNVMLLTVAPPEEMDDIKSLPRTKKAREKSRPVPNVKPNALRKLKGDLVNADKARVIVTDLKRMDVPLAHAAPAAPASPLPPIYPSNPRGYSLPALLDSSVSAHSSPGQSSSVPFTLLDLPSLPPTSAGGLAGLASAKSGAFEVLADVSGALVRKSGSQERFEAPRDRVGVFLYWWGYELSLPPPALETLASLQSVQQTFFTFLQAFVGAPELAPFVRYVSSYVDMEISAIRSQDKGYGVVLAATWLLPVALVPRPWDFPLQSRSLPTTPAAPAAPVTPPLPLAPDLV
ncbi:hypothetical protein JCM1841_000363 [Sporobolomyces salmonicolor]